MEAENIWLGKRILNANDILETLSTQKFKETIFNKDLRESKRNEALNFYNKNRMVEEYIKALKIIP